MLNFGFDSEFDIGRFMLIWLCVFFSSEIVSFIGSFVVVLFLM